MQDEVDPGIDPLSPRPRVHRQPGYPTCGIAPAQVADLSGQLVLWNEARFAARAQEPERQPGAAGRELDARRTQCDAHPGRPSQHLGARIALTTVGFERDRVSAGRDAEPRGAGHGSSRGADDGHRV